jgi:hypothetical protein
MNDNAGAVRPLSRITARPRTASKNFEFNGETRFAAILEIICKLTKFQHLFGLEIRQFARIREF